MTNIFFKSIVSGSTSVIHVPDDRDITGDLLYHLVVQQEGIPPKLIGISLNGKSVPRSADKLIISGPDVSLQVYVPCVGGKGGFGSMLRAIGAQIEKTTNKDACRDLSGRRLRDVNAEKKIKEYIAKQAKRKEQENKKRKEKLARLRREPKIEFKDDEYFKSRSELPEVVDDAVMQGIKKVLGTTEKKQVACASATVTSTTVTCHVTPDPSDQGSSLPVISEEHQLHPVPSSSSASIPAVKRKELESTTARSGVSQKKKKSKKSSLWLGVDEEDISSDEE